MTIPSPRTTPTTEDTAPAALAPSYPFGSGSSAGRCSSTCWLHATLLHRMFRPRQQKRAYKKKGRKGQKTRPFKFPISSCSPSLSHGRSAGQRGCTFLHACPTLTKEGRQQGKRKEDRTRAKRAASPDSLVQNSRRWPSHISRIDHIWRGCELPEPGCCWTFAKVENPTRQKSLGGTYFGGGFPMHR